MMESLFGNVVIEKVLFYLLANNECYPSELREVFQTPLYSFQRALARLESGGIVVSHHKGKTLLYQFNPRYPCLKELKSLLQRAYDGFPQEVREKYYEQPIRKRPRRQGKPL